MKIGATAAWFDLRTYNINSIDLVERDHSSLDIYFQHLRLLEILQKRYLISHWIKPRQWILIGFIPLGMFLIIYTLPLWTNFYIKPWPPMVYKTSHLQPEILIWNLTEPSEFCCFQASKWISLTLAKHRTHWSTTKAKLFERFRDLPLQFTNLPTGV